jgi:hypothetical protein
MSKSGPAADAKPVDKDAALRKDIIRTIKGPITERVAAMVPALASSPEPYSVVISSPELLYACIQLFRTKREIFQDLLVDEAGGPVTEDTSALRCGRNIEQIISMVVRSGAKAYSEKRFAPQQSGTQQLKPETRGLLDKLMALVGAKWGGESEKGPSKPGVNSAADKFYAAIKDNLDFDWQVPLIPYFAELPVKLIIEMGRGVTTLRSPEGIAALADIGRHSMESARRILSDGMMREMLDTQPLAAKGVAFLGKERYEFLHGTVYEKMGDKFWEMCVDCDRLEAMETQNAKDLEQMANHLHIISAETINQVVHYIQFNQIPVFLDIARDKLGDEKFTEIFGVPGKKKLIKTFCEKIKATKVDPADPVGDLAKKLPDVFGAYLRAPKDFEKGL